MLENSKVEEIQNYYAGKYAKSDLLDDAYEATDYFSDLGNKGKWLRLTAAVIRDSLGAIVSAAGTIKDILTLIHLLRDDKFSFTHKINTGVL